MTRRGGHGGQGSSYEIKRFPRARRLIVDATRVGKKRSMIHGLIDVDITDARRLIADHTERTGEKLSFTAFVIACVGRAVSRNRMVHARRDLLGRLVIFDDVDITTFVELPRAGGGSFPVPHVVRAANHRSPWEIHREIRAVQEAGIDGLPLSVKALVGTFVMLPGPMRRTAFRALLRSPELMRRICGTVSVTAVGMFGRRGGHGIAAPSMFGLEVVLGGIETRPAWLDERVVPRQFLDMTVSFDHDIVDGAPAARFVRELRALMQQGATLEHEVELSNPVILDDTVALVEPLAELPPELPPDLDTPERSGHEAA